MDASKTSIGGCLAVLKDDILRPIAYSSRILGKHERNYSIYSLELLALVENVTKTFSYALSNRFFICLTDHLPLVSLPTSSFDNLSGRELRWRIKLARFDFKVIHIKGSFNAIADSLSRLTEGDECRVDNNFETVENLKTFLVTTRSGKAKEQEDLKADNSTNLDDKHDDFVDVTNDDFMTKNIINSLNDSAKRDPEHGIDEIEPEETKISEAKRVTSAEEQRHLIKLFHTHPLVGHLGVRRGILRLRERFFWKGMYKDYKDFVKNCEVCQVSKHRNNARNVPLGRIKCPDTPWDTLYIDIAGPLPLTPENFKYFLIVQCATTRFTVCEPLGEKTSDSIAETILQNLSQARFPKSNNF